MVATIVLNAVTDDVEKFDPKAFELASNDTFLSKNASGALEWKAVDTTDPTAFHSDVLNEIYALTPIGTLAVEDCLVVEDNSASNVKRKATLADVKTLLDTPETQFELRTTDLPATAENLGRCWVRTDLDDTVRIVVVASGPVYTVKTFTLT